MTVIKAETHKDVGHLVLVQPSKGAGLPVEKPALDQSTKGGRGGGRR